MITVGQLREQFSGHVKLQEKRPGVYQLYAPLYHEDGDMLDIFLEEMPGGLVRVSDSAMTLMRLSYTYDLDTENKERIFQTILSENQILESDGNLYLEVSPERLYPAIMQFSQTVAKIGSMRLYRREVIQSLFYEQLNDFVSTELKRFNPQPRAYPIPDREELEVDYELRPGIRPVYLFGVRDNAKARLVTISCQAFRIARLPFRSFVVHQDFNSLSAKDRMRITSAVDKQFPSLDDFRALAVEFLEREAAA